MFRFKCLPAPSLHPQQPAPAQHCIHQSGVLLIFTAALLAQQCPINMPRTLLMAVLKRYCLQSLAWAGTPLHPPTVTQLVTPRDRHDTRPGCDCRLGPCPLELQTKVHEDFTITASLLALSQLMCLKCKSPSRRFKPGEDPSSRGLLCNCEIFANLHLKL